MHNCEYSIYKPLGLVSFNFRSVRDSKGWRWYKHPDQLSRFELRQYGGAVTCNLPGCEFLPPMDLQALQRHMEIAHTDRNRTEL